MRLRDRLRDDRGFTLVELMIVSLLTLTVLSIAGAFINSSLNFDKFADQETASLDSARVAQAQILKDLRSAVGVDTTTNTTCTANDAPAGYCMLLYYQSPSTGVTDQIRYRAVQTGGATGPTTLYRDTGCDPSFTCTGSIALVDNLNNRAASTVMFSCDTTSSYPQIQVTLVVFPLSTAEGNGRLTIQTRGRPRNIGGTSC